MAENQNDLGKRPGGQINPDTGKLLVIEESKMSSLISAWEHIPCGGTPLTDARPNGGPPICFCGNCENPPIEHPPV